MIPSMPQGVEHSLTAAEEVELIRLLEAESRERFPDTGPFRRELYPKHIEFFRSGSKYLERLFIAANRLGKTQAACYELVCHLTGHYPAWWEGRRFTRAIRAWAAGTTNEKVQEILQEALLGPVGQWGSGLIPREAIVRSTRAPGSVPDLLDTVWVRHQSGGWSVLTFKAYKQGRTAFEGTQQDVILEDEEPPLAVHIECLLRVMDITGRGESGLVMTTFTPLQGMSETVLHFLPEGRLPEPPGANGRYVVQAGWEDDPPHLDAATRQAYIAAIPAFQRDARTRGIPVLGAGLIYPVPEESYLIDPFPLPKHWRKAYGLDVGWNRTAAVWGAYDPDTDCWYLYHEHYLGQVEPSVHAAAIKAPGAWIAGVIDPASRGRTQDDGTQLLETYQQLGLKLTMAANGIYAGIYQVWERLSQGRLKVFRTLRNFQSEIRLYRRDEHGNIVKVNDHLMDACRYLMMSGLEVAKPQTPSPLRMRQPGNLVSAGGGNQGWMV